LSNFIPIHADPAHNRPEWAIENRSGPGKIEIFSKKSTGNGFGIEMILLDGR
jgi:hypothetical protein